MKIDGNLSKIVLWGIIGALVLILIFYSFGTGNKFNDDSSKSNAGGGNIPSECQLPDGQELSAWKEHLGHHQETKYCLEYFK